MPTKPLAVLTAAILAALSLPARAQEPEPLKIGHTPPGCLAVDRFSTLRVHVDPISQVYRARVLFRTDAAAEPHAVEMKQDAEDFVAVLPKAGPTLSEVRYSIEVVDPALNEVRTEETVVRVGKCDKPAPSQKKARVEVEAPLGGPLVPAGFVEEAAVAEGTPEEPAQAGIFKLSPKTSAIAALTVLAAGAAVVTVGVADPPPPNEIAQPETPGISFIESTPPPGSTIGPERGSFTMVVRIVPATTVNGVPRFEMRQSPAGPVCAVSELEPNTFLEANFGRNVRIRGPLSTGACGSEFEVTNVRVMLATSTGQPLLSTGTDFPDLSLRYLVRQ